MATCRLGRAFEQMRLSLKARLDELNRLLLVSKGVASSLDVGEAVKPVLEAALVSGAASARVVLDPAALPDLEGTPQTPPSFYQGSAGERFAYLDEQILALNRQQDKVAMPSLARRYIGSSVTSRSWKITAPESGRMSCGLGGASGGSPVCRGRASSRGPASLRSRG